MSDVVEVRARNGLILTGQIKTLSAKTVMLQNGQQAKQSFTNGCVAVVNRSQERVCG